MNAAKATVPRDARGEAFRTRLLPAPLLDSPADVAHFLEHDASAWLELERDLAGQGLHLPAELVDDLARVLRAAGAVLRGERVEIEDGSAHPQARAMLAAIASSDVVRRGLAGTRGAKRLQSSLGAPR